MTSNKGKPLEHAEKMWELEQRKRKREAWILGVIIVGLTLAVIVMLALQV